MIIPILVRTFGCSGSTLLMQILASSQDIVFERRYPFEVRYLTYLTRTAQLITSERNKGLPFEWGQNGVGPFWWTLKV